MLLHFGEDLLAAEWPGAVVCIGTFDGIHLGHQALIRRTVEVARAEHLASVILTFDRHPAATLAPDRVPHSINTLRQNLAQIEALGPSACVILEFNQELADCPAEQFFQKILINHLHAKSMVVGHDFAFGHNRVGTGEWLKQRINCEIIEAVSIHGLRVSSSEIRKAVVSADFDAAKQLLRRPFQLQGVVVQGQQLGRTLGYPTANLARFSDQIVPQNGIYATTAHTGYGSFTAAASIGVRPTVGGESRSIEAFLLDYPGDSLYGQTVSLDFHARLRDELKFDSIEELKAQMAIDVEQTRQMMIT